MKANLKLMFTSQDEPRGHRMSEDMAIVKNQLRMLRNHHRRIMNLIKLRRLGEAEYESRTFSGILRAWDMQNERRQESCVKMSNPTAPMFLHAPRKMFRKVAEKIIVNKVKEVQQSEKKK